MLPQPLEPPDAAESSDARIPSLVEEDRRAVTIRGLRHAGALFLQALVLVVLASLFFVRLPLVDGHSMAPQIDDGDRVLIDTLAYDVRVQQPGADSAPVIDLPLHAIRRGDVVAFAHGTGDDRRVYLKRVIALPGETISIARGVIWVDGALFPDVFGARLDKADMSPVQVPDDSIFVIGDNRGDSDDSRAFGPVRQLDVIGKAVLVAWPPNRARAIR